MSTALNRRQFLGLTSVCLAAPAILGGNATARGASSPSNQIALGVIGCGGMGTGNTNSFLGLPECRVVAACDVDKNHLSELVGTVNKRYGNNDCRPYHDFRELLGRRDIDAVMIAVPDHWHALVAVEAARRGKDIYGEKPLAHTIAEQQAIVRAVQEHQRIWQMGSWQRSVPEFHKAAEIVRNGLIGQVQRVEVGLPSGNKDATHSKPLNVVTEPPPELDFEMWTGPAQRMFYIPSRVHKNWRWNYNTGGGQLMDWVGHHCDIAHWGLGFDNSGPLEVNGTGEFPPPKAIWNTAAKYRIELTYPNNIAMTIAGGDKEIRSGTKWIGTEGWVWVDRGHFDASNQEWRDMKQIPEDQRKIKLIISRNHQRNFLESVRSRQPTITPVETGHHSTIPGHLGLISMLVGRKLRWDNQSEQIINDLEASELLTRPYRYPWKLE
jgi:predicted dehydrogenase